MSFQMYTQKRGGGGGVQRKRGGMKIRGCSKTMGVDHKNFHLAQNEKAAESSLTEEPEEGGTTRNIRQA